MLCTWLVSGVGLRLVSGAGAEAGVGVGGWAHRVALVLLHHLLERAVVWQWWGRLVVLSPPSHHLLHSMLLCKRALVISCEETRVLLVQPRILVQRHPALVHA